MRKFYYFLLFVALMMAVTSCQKETSNEDGVTQPQPPAGGPVPSDTTPTGNTEVGNWKFVNLSGTMSNTAEFSQAGVGAKAVNTGSFTSQHNGGTVTFNNSTMTANGITMAVNANTTTNIYLNGLLVDTRQT